MVPYKKPDLNAPRFRKKRISLLTPSFFSKVREKHPNLSNKEIRRIIETFNDEIVNTVVDKRDGVELLEQLGYFFIGTCQRSKKHLHINEPLSVELGVRVYEQFPESDGYTAKIFYTNYETKYQFKFHNLWGFSSSRNFARKASHAYLKEWKKYIMVENGLQISRLYRKHKTKDFIKKQVVDFLLEYDEFDMT